jgi:hypothetical protein
MPDIAIEQEPTLDILEQEPSPALSARSDIPVVQTTPDSVQPPDEGGEAEQAAPDPEVEDAGVTPDSESATESADEHSGEPEGPKKSRGVQKKLDELRAQAEQARREVEAEREDKRRLMALLERQSGPQEAPAGEQAVQPPAEPVRPNRADFQDDDEWDNALVEYSEQRSEWIAKREIDAQLERQREEAQRQAIMAQRQRAAETYEAKVEEAQGKYRDFDTVARNPDVTISYQMADAIMFAPNGPDIQYYLGSNPAEAKRLSQMPREAMLYELGRISHMVSSPAPAPAPANQTKAPPAIKPLKSGETPPVVKDPNSMSPEEYVAWRKAGGGK